MIHPGERDRRPPLQYAPSAFNVLGFAIEEARLRGNPNSIGIHTEHILLGLLREPTTREILAQEGAELGRARTQLDFLFGRRLIYPQKPIFSLKVVKLVRRAAEDAFQDNGGIVTSVHILRALASEREALALGVLESMNVRQQQLYEKAKQARHNDLPLS